jgi:hypothetical protein
VIHQVAYQLIVTRRGTGPDPQGIRQMSGNSAIQGSMAKNAAKYALSPLTRFRRDMAGPEACQRREAVKDFIILTDFSRCQGPMIGRVSRRPEQPIFQDKDFP